MSSLIFTLITLFLLSIHSNALGVFQEKFRSLKLALNPSISKTIIISTILANSLGLASPVLANVGEGGLPDGALAFSKLVKYQSDWKTLAESVEKRKNEIDDKEIINIKFFLKQLANEYFDMEVKLF